MGARVSIILPTHERAHTLPRAIGSILDQTYQDWELIVVDDRSTDGTREVVERFDDDRIRYVRRHERGGGAQARNTGLQAAEGDLVAFQDSDDAWRPRKLARQVRRFDAGPERMVYCSFWRRMGRHRKLRPGLFERHRQGEMLPSLLWTNPVTTAAALVERDLLVQVGGFDDHIPRFHDWDLWIRIAQRTRFAHLPWPDMIQYPQPDSISHDAAATVLAHLHILEKYPDLFAAHPTAHARRLRLLAEARWRNGEDPADTLRQAAALEAT